jgi:hypothetical protein
MTKKYLTELNYFLEKSLKEEREKKFFFVSMADLKSIILQLNFWRYDTQHSDPQHNDSQHNYAQYAELIGDTA